MNRRMLVVSVAAVALLGFAGAGAIYTQTKPVSSDTAEADDLLVRRHSPVIGPTNAKVTIVEFFDPSCEACRAYYPIVKQILAEHPADIRLVLRYAPFHKGSDEAVRILETARLQGVFEKVLDALVAAQPEWAIHGSPPRLDRAWSAAEAAGLDLVNARADSSLPTIANALEQDVADGKMLRISGTPTFYVNGKELREMSPRNLYQLVLRELGAAS
jgi:protein-disulfide isomerase